MIYPIAGNIARGPRVEEARAYMEKQDQHVLDLIETTCAKIRTKFPEATFEVCAHPTQRGAIIDAYVPTDDDFAVLDLVNPELVDLLIEEDIAIYVRAIGPLKGI